MAGRTSAGTREPGRAASLSPTEQDEIRLTDDADVSPRAATPSHSVAAKKKLRAIPAVITKNGDTGTRVEIRKADFSRKGISHDSVVFDVQKNNFTLPVGNGDDCISKEAADFLVNNYPTSFEYISG